MKLVIKNKTLDTILNRGKEATANGTTRDIGYSFIGGYVYSLLDIAEWPEVNLPLDLTYSTIKNLAPSVGWEFAAGMNPKSGYSADKNIEIAEKTIASYLMCLALNEENAVISVKKATDRTIETINSPERWSGFDITVTKGVVSVDYLKEIHGSVIFQGNKLIVYMDKAISVYKRLTGNDLAAYGADSLSADFPS